MREPTVEPIPAPTEQDVVFTRYFSASPALVYDLWTQRKHLERWWGPDGSTLTGCELDLRPGGHLRFTVKLADGSEHSFHGNYLALVPGEWILFSAILEDGGEPVLTSVSLEELGAMTRMDVRQTVPRSRRMAEGQLTGWLESLTRLSEYVLGM